MKSIVILTISEEGKGNPDKAVDAIRRNPPIQEYLPICD